MLAEPRPAIRRPGRYSHVYFRSVLYYISSRQQSGRFTLSTPSFLGEHQVNDSIDIDDHAPGIPVSRSRLRPPSSLMNHPRVDMLKFGSLVIQSRIVRTVRAVAPSNQRFSSSQGPEPTIPSSGYTLPSGDTIPSVGLGTWRANGEEVGKAVKVSTPEQSSG